MASRLEFCRLVVSDDDVVPATSAAPETAPPATKTDDVTSALPEVEVERELKIHCRDGRQLITKTCLVDEEKAAEKMQQNENEPTGSSAANSPLEDAFVSTGRRVSLKSLLESRSSDNPFATPSSASMEPTATTASDGMTELTSPVTDEKESTTKEAQAARPSSAASSSTKGGDLKKKEVTSYYAQRSNKWFPPLPVRNTKSSVESLPGKPGGSSSSTTTGTGSSLDGTGATVGLYKASSAKPLTTTVYEVIVQKTEFYDPMKFMKMEEAVDPRGEGGMRASGGLFGAKRNAFGDDDDDKPWWARGANHQPTGWDDDGPQKVPAGTFGSAKKAAPKKKMAAKKSTSNDFQWGSSSGGGAWEASEWSF